jgi:hypothetical protein
MLGLRSQQVLHYHLEQGAKENFAMYLISLLLLIAESKVHIKSMLNKVPGRTKVVCQNGNISREHVMYNRCIQA